MCTLCLFLRFLINVGVNKTTDDYFKKGLNTIPFV